MDLKLSNSEMKRLFTPMKEAVLTYKMIEDGDRVAVGLSGGKDSSTLLVLLTSLRERMNINFDIVPVSLSLGFDDMDVSPLVDFVKSLGHSLHMQETNISQVVFDYKQEKNPCSLCANLRRGKLFNFAKSLDCNKVAYGHHLDDGIETFFMNFLYGSKFATFQPTTYMSRADITLIRPMLAIEENHIIQFVKAHNIPIVHNPCPADKHTKREEVKALINKLSEQYPDIRKRFLTGAANVDARDFWNVP